jgi:hypothetical protein
MMLRKVDEEADVESVEVSIDFSITEVRKENELLDKK